MNISMMDYLNWNPTMPPGIKHGFHETDGIAFGWLDLRGDACYASFNTIEKAEGFIAGFDAGLGADR